MLFVIERLDKRFYIHYFVTYGGTMATPATNTVTKALLEGEDEIRKQELIDFLKERDELSEEAEEYLQRKTW